MIFSPCVADIRHWHMSPVDGSCENTSNDSCRVRPHSKNKICFQYNIYQIIILLIKYLRFMNLKKNICSKYSQPINFMPLFCTIHTVYTNLNYKWDKVYMGLLGNILVRSVLLIFLVFSVVFCILLVFVLCLVCPMFPVSLDY